MATWNKLNIDSATLAADSTGATNKSLFIGAYPPGDPNAVATAAIYGGNNRAILDDPAGNISKLFFHTAADYLRVKKVVNFTITLPARNVRTTSGGKKGYAANTSYNGYADHYIYQHNYGDPPPFFTIAVTGDTTNGALANHGLTGSIPLQFVNSDSFRLGLAYSTDKYLVLRERYQVYSASVPALTLKVRAYFFDQSSFINTYNSLRITHSPLFEELTHPNAYVNGVVRNLTTTYTFNSSLGATFNQVILERTGGPPTSWQGPKYNYYWWTCFIDQLDGTAVTAFDPFTSPAGYNTQGNSGPQTYNFPSQKTSWSFRLNTVGLFPVPGGQVTSPTYRVKFVNTANGATYTDYVGVVHRFPT